MNITENEHMTHTHTHNGTTIFILLIIYLFYISEMDACGVRMCGCACINTEALWARYCQSHQLMAPAKWMPLEIRNDINGVKYGWVASTLAQVNGSWTYEEHEITVRIYSRERWENIDSNRIASVIQLKLRHPIHSHRINLQTAHKLDNQTPSAKNGMMVREPVWNHSSASFLFEGDCDISSCVDAHCSRIQMSSAQQKHFELILKGLSASIFNVQPTPDALLVMTHTHMKIWKK